MITALLHQRVPCTRSARGVGCFLILTAFSQLGCESESPANKGSDVRLEADATGEALDAMLAVEAESWDWSAGFVRAPSAGAELPGDVPFTFTWTTELAHEDADAASEPALAGVAFLLDFSSPAHPSMLRVFTSLYDYTPSDKDWSALASSGEEITLHVDAADFSGNQIVKNGGPFSGIGVTFTIAASVER